MPLTKQTLIENVCRKLPLSHNDAAHLMEQFLELVKSKLASGGALMISGFGKFLVPGKRFEIPPGFSAGLTAWLFTKAALRKRLSMTNDRFSPLC
jgi:hypothetical protein